MKFVWAAELLNRRRIVKMPHTQDSKFKRLFNNNTMYKYDGLLIHQDYDDDGALEVVEADGVRSLHFGSLPRQSSMLLSDPHKLYLEYAKTMSTWMLFKETLNDDALLIGLGGGSVCCIFATITLGYSGVIGIVFNTTFGSGIAANSTKSVGG